MKTGVSVVEPHHHFIGDITVDAHHPRLNPPSGCEVLALPGLRVDAHQHRVLIPFAIPGRHQVAAIEGPVRTTLGAILTTGQ